MHCMWLAVLADKKECLWVGGWAFSSNMYPFSKNPPSIDKLPPPLFPLRLSSLKWDTTRAEKKNALGAAATKMPIMFYKQAQYRHPDIMGLWTNRMSLYMFLKMSGMSVFTVCACLWCTSITVLVADVEDIHIIPGNFIAFFIVEKIRCPIIFFLNA